MKNEDLKLISDLYAAAGEPAHWPAALAHLRRQFGSVAVDLYIEQQREVVFVQQCGGLNGVWDDYFNHYYYINPRIDALAVQPVGVDTDARFIGHRAMQRSEFYMDFLRRAECGYMMGGPILRTAQGVAYLGVHLPFDHREPSSGRIDRLAGLWPHLQRVVTIQQRLIEVTRRQTLLQQSLDVLDMGVIVVDRDRKVLYQNAFATALIERGNGIGVICEHLVALGPCHGGDLQTCIASATSPIIGAHTEAGGTLTVGRGPGRSRLTLVVMPRPEQVSGSGGTATVFVTDPDTAQRHNAAMLRAIFSLSARECALAMALIDGQSAETYSRRNHVAMPTVRTQLRAILSKTGTKKQAQAVARMLTALPGIAP